MTISLEGKMIFCHGPPKVGKTQMATSFPLNVVFLATENGHKYIPEHQKKRLIYLPNGRMGWIKFLEVIKNGSIEKRKPGTVVIDTTNKLYVRCGDYVASSNNWKHVADGHQRGWKFLGDEFLSGITKLSELAVKNGWIVLFLDHSRVTEIKDIVSEYHKVEADIGKQVREVVIDNADHIWYLSYTRAPEHISPETLRTPGDERWLYIGGNESLEAGTRDPEISRKSLTLLKEVPTSNQYEWIVSKLNG